MKEKLIMTEVMKALSALKATIFRSNVGFGWAGNSITRISYKGSFFCNPGDVIVRKASPLHAGLIVGASDLIGWSSKTITPDMVGEKVAVFLAVEVKGPKGKVSKEQANFIDKVNQAGGLAFVAYSKEQAEEIYKQHTNQ